MDKSQRQGAAKEWASILREHPRFARTFLAQQVILMEAAQAGNQLIDARMCRLLEMGWPVLFADYWAARCGTGFRPDLGGIWDCLRKERKSEDCFSIRHEDEFFDDLKGERPVLENPPIPPLGP